MLTQTRAGGLSFPCRAGGGEGAFSRLPRLAPGLLGHLETRGERHSKGRQK